MNCIPFCCIKKPKVKVKMNPTAIKEDVKFNVTDFNENDSQMIYPLKKTHSLSFWHINEIPRENIEANIQTESNSEIKVFMESGFLISRYYRNDTLILERVKGEGLIEISVTESGINFKRV